MCGLDSQILKKWRWRICAAIFLLFVNRAAIADSEKIAVFLPVAQEPYKSIYQQVISGVRSAAEASASNVSVEAFLLDKTSNSEQINSALDDQNIVNIIVLGRLGWRLAKQLANKTIDITKPNGDISTQKKYNIISGALPITPNGISGISLITDPSDLFRYLLQVAPKVKNIHVAYSEKNQWLIDLAQVEANTQGLNFFAKKVQTTKQAIEYYQRLFASGVAQQDALWLPLDKITSHDKVILPIVLENAWAKEVAVFSSKPSHAKRGVLFSTYPDNFSLGKDLFSMTQSLAKNPEQILFSPLKSTLLAVNLRTAAHLGFKYSNKQQKQFKLTFPEY